MIKRDTLQVQKPNRMKLNTISDPSNMHKAGKWNRTEQTLHAMYMCVCVDRFNDFHGVQEYLLYMSVCVLCTRFHLSNNASILYANVCVCVCFVCVCVCVCVCESDAYGVQAIYITMQVCAQVCNIHLHVRFVKIV